MSHQTIIYDTKLLPIPANSVGADKIIDVSKRIEMNSPKMIRNLSENKFFVEGKIILQIIYEENTDLNQVKVLQMNLPFLSLLPEIPNLNVPIIASFSQFNVELLNEHMMSVSYILLISVDKELDEPKIEQNNNPEIQAIDSMEKNILKLEIKNDKKQVEQVEQVEQTEKLGVQKITNTSDYSPNNPDTVFLASEDYTAVKKQQKKERNLEWHIPYSTKKKSKSKVISKPREEQKAVKRKEKPLKNKYKPLLTLKESKTTLSFKNLSNK